MGDKDLALMSFNLFEQDIQENFPKLNVFFSESNYMDYAKLLHKWKPNFKMFGNQLLSEEVSEIERALKQSEKMLTVEYHEQIKSKITEGIKQIKQNII